MRGVLGRPDKLHRTFCHHVDTSSTFIRQPSSCANTDLKSVTERILRKENDMTGRILAQFDRLDENFSKPKAPEHVIVEEDTRGRLNLKNDRSQHRRYTAFYSDLQN